MAARFGRLGFLTLAFAVASATATAAFDLKTITLKVGYGAGGTFDLSSRLIAEHLGRFLPGSPEIIVQNVPGGGSLKLTKLMLTSEPKDGSVIGSVSPAMSLAPILDPEGAGFDAADIVWLGALSTEPAFCATTEASGIDSLEEFLGSEFLVGASGKASTVYQQAAMVRNGLGAKFNIVTGFDGVAEINLAMERGEIAGHCSISVTDLKRDDLGPLNVFIRFGAEAPGEFEDVPTFSSLISDPTMRDAAEFFESITRSMNYPLMVPRGVPEEVVAELRAAYSEMTGDPEFVAAVGVLGNFDLDATPGERMQEAMGGLQDADPAVLAALRNLVQ